ncbi:hypothetical protein [Paraburkholderia sp. J12]|uniref:hypothetical protein n=1 Tax=Paraburkholderia sp. J12 TaxID=2805432 RepID=UPI002ABD8BA6|nr:hypothetical protein [Paraburkholderia sp. J12]
METLQLPLAEVVVVACPDTQLSARLALATGAPVAAVPLMVAGGSDGVLEPPPQPENKDATAMETSTAECFFLIVISHNRLARRVDRRPVARWIDVNPVHDESRVDCVLFVVLFAIGWTR